MYETAYQRLEENLIDMIMEEQAKLGYMKEPIRLYYPLSTLNHMFGIVCNAKEMEEVLAGFPERVATKFGEVNVSRKKERFCFFLASEATEYVHEHKSEDPFIFQLIDLVRSHETTMDDIKNLFLSVQPECVIQTISQGDFDVMIRFVDTKDPYYYCFKEEGCHIIYHRFLPEDYEELGV